MWHIILNTENNKYMVLSTEDGIISDCLIDDDKDIWTKHLPSLTGTTPDNHPEPLDRWLSSDKQLRLILSFESKESEFRGIYFSKPYIVTNTRYGKSNRNELLIQRNERLNTLYNDYYETLEEYNKADTTQKSRLEPILKSKSERLNAEINKNNIKGKAVVFATHSKYIFDEDDNIISEDQYGDYYIDQMNGKYDNDPDRRDKIRMIILNPEGQTFQSFISKYREFINSYKKNSGVAKYNGKFYKSYF